MSLIEVRSLEKKYDDTTRAVRNITLDIENGEFVAIMGPSGSGKSTLLHMLGFLDKQTSGTYKFDGNTIDDYTEDELAHVRNKKTGFVFQAFNLLSRASVYKNVMLPLYYSDVPESDWDRRINLSIESVGMSHRRDHAPNELSGGEKQRAAIARALVNDPEIIFADEPTGNLDSVSGKSLMETLKTLHESGKTIVVITHDDEVSAFAHRMIRLRDGAIESDAKTKS